MFQPPVHAILMKDLYDIITSDIVIAKIDIEGYECKVSNCIECEVQNHKLQYNMYIIKYKLLLCCMF